MSRNLLRATSVISAFTFLSRILGFARDMVFANFFGAGTIMDAFFVAFKIPNFMRRLFAEGAFSQAFVPVLSEHKSTTEHAEVKDLVDHVAGTLGGILLLITVVGIVAAPLLIYTFAWGFSAEPDKFALTAAMLRVTFPYLLFISLTAFAGGILNTYDRFGVPAFTPVFLNISLISAAVWAAPYFEQPGMALAWGVFIAGFAQLAFQLPFLARLRLLPRPRWGLARSAVKRIINLMVPALFGSSVAQVNLLLDTLIASFLATGSVSWLYYSDRLMEFPLGVFGIALGTVVLPNLSKRYAEKSTEQFSNMLDWALRLVVVVGVPASVGLLTLGGPILVTLFNHGEFDSHDARMATASLMPFAVGMFAFTLVKILAPGYYARQDTRTPVRIGIWTVVVNMLSNLLLVVPWAWYELPAPHAGLAVSTSLAAFLNAGLLLKGLRRKVYRPCPGWGPLVTRVLLANAVMGGLLFAFSGSLELWISRSTWQRVEWLTLWIAIGASSYLLALLVLGLRPRHLKSQ